MANQGAILNSSATSTVMITLKPSEGGLVTVNEATAMESGVVKLVLEDPADLVIPLPNVAGRVLDRVIYYWKRSLSLSSMVPPSTQLHLFGRLGDWRLHDENDKSIVELVKAADYLDIKVLLAFLMPSFKRRFELGDDKGVEYVYTEELEAKLLNPAALASGLLASETFF